MRELTKQMVETANESEQIIIKDVATFMNSEVDKLLADYK